MPDTDPFADAAFVTRLQKLLAMLASAQPGEADAARRKMLEHLGTQRLSLTDVANRLGRNGPKASAAPGGREPSLERQLSIARAAKAEAEHEAAVARHRLAEMMSQQQRASAEVSRALAAQAQARTMGSIAWLVAAICIGLLVFPRMHGLLHPSQMAGVTQEPALMAATDPEQAERALRAAPGQRIGTVLVQDLAVRLTPSDDAGVRAFLNQGMRVVIEQQVRIGPQTWLSIRSLSGSGWVRAGDILH